MNKTAMKGQWKQLRTELKAQWDKLSENDLLDLEDDLDKMVGLFQKRYGYNRENALESLGHFVDEYRGRAQDLVAEGLDYVRPQAKKAKQKELATSSRVSAVAIASLVMTLAAVLLIRFVMQRQE